MPKLQDLVDFMRDGALRATSDLEAHGFNRDMVRRAARAGAISEVARGAYRVGEDVCLDPFEEVATAWFMDQGSVVSFSTAAALHGMSDAPVNNVHLLYNFGANPSSRTAGIGIDVVPHWSRDPNRLSVGVMRRRIAGLDVPITDPHRTFLDFVTASTLGEMEIGHKVLVDYVRDHYDAKTLGAHARALGISRHRYDKRVADIRHALEYGSSVSDYSPAP